MLSSRSILVGLSLLTLAAASGCTSLHEYIHNGFKVGPNYPGAAAQVAETWIDVDDQRVRTDPEDQVRWWTVFNDDVLNCLVVDAQQQNLSLREAGFRILDARALVAVAEGRLFPQTQNMTASYRRAQNSTVLSNSNFLGQRFFSQWAYGFNLAWELDFWGRFRRAIDAADDQLDASVANYDDVLVTLQGDVATNYIQMRTAQERIALTQMNVDLQRRILDVIRNRYEIGFKEVTKVDVDQGISTLKQTEALVPQLEIDQRLANNRLCVLLGVPPVDLPKRYPLWEHVDRQKKERLDRANRDIERLLERAGRWTDEDQRRVQELRRQAGGFYLPTIPREVVVSIPAELLRRRPDVRRAERQAAAQAEEIGIATTDLYPAFSITGSLGQQARLFPDLFTRRATTGSIQPGFQWNLLHYGRILHSIRALDARFQASLAVYEQTVLNANADVENGIVTFLNSQDRAALLRESVAAGYDAVTISRIQLNSGKIDFNQYAVIQQNLVQQQDVWAQSRGQIALGLIQVYRALGGGWLVRCEPNWDTSIVTATSPPPRPDNDPPPVPERTPERLPPPR